MLSGRGPCEELITRPEESYRLWCVVVCDLETSRIGAPYIYDISSLRVKVITGDYCGLGSVVAIATGYGLGGPGIESRWGSRFSAPVQTGPGAHPASCTMGTGCFLGVKSGQGVTLTPYPLLVPWSRKGRAIPLLTLWVVRPVQNLSACTRVHILQETIMNDSHTVEVVRAYFNHVQSKLFLTITTI